MSHMDDHSPLVDETLTEIAELIHAAGLTTDQLGADDTNLLIGIPAGRAVIVPPSDNHWLILTNDDLTRPSDYLMGDRWAAVLEKLRSLESKETGGRDEA